MVQLLSWEPYSFCVAWGGFVLGQFRTRYCGHTLSRLAEIRHNMTKQTRFPTVRRKSLKSWNTWNTIQVVSDLVGLRLHWVLIGGREAMCKVEIKLSMPFLHFSWGVGWLVLCRINDAFPVHQQDMLIWNGLWAWLLYRPCRKGGHKSQAHMFCACNEWGMWTTCW